MPEVWKLLGDLYNKALKDFKGKKHGDNKENYLFFDGFRYYSLTQVINKALERIHFDRFTKDCEGVFHPCRHAFCTYMEYAHVPNAKKFTGHGNKWPQKYIYLASFLDQRVAEISADDEIDFSIEA